MAFPLKRYLASIVILVSLVFHGSGIYFHNDVLKPLEEVSSDVAMLIASDEDCWGIADFKPPKSSFTDYAAACSIDGLLSDYVPSIADHEVGEVFQFLPEVYLDIFVPPQNVSPVATPSRPATASAVC